jgi:hypothetical protein
MANATIPQKRVQLLIDHTGTLNPGGGKVLVERKEGGKIILRGELGRADVVTSNNRLYPRSVVEREVRRLEKEAKARKLYGELDHPADGRTQFQRVSHLICEIRLEDDGRVMGAMELIPTQKGKDIIAIIESGGAVGCSSRGTGTTHKRNDGVDVVNEDYTMITYDLVADPAHSAAYPEVFFESKDVLNLGRVEKMPDKIATKPAAPAVKPALKTENVDVDVQAQIKAALDKERAKIRAEEQEKLKAQVESDLVAQIELIKKEAAEDAKSEIASDPKLADARRRMEAVRAALGVGEGNSVPKDELEKIQTAVAERDAQLATMTKELEVATKKLAESEALCQAIALKTKKNAMERYIEKQANASPDSALFKKLISGRVTEEDSAELLQAKVAEVNDILKSFKTRDDQKAAKVEDLSKQIKAEVAAQTAETNQKVAELEQANKALAESNQRLRLAAEKSIELGKKGYAEAFKHKTLAEHAGNHPSRHKILSLLEQSNLSSPDEIESFIKEAIKNEGKDSVLLEQVRSSVRKGTGSLLNEDGSEKPSLLTRSAGAEGKLYGQDLATMRRLAGIK